MLFMHLHNICIELLMAENASWYKVIAIELQDIYGTVSSKMILFQIFQDKQKKCNAPIQNV